MISSYLNCFQPAKLVWRIFDLLGTSRGGFGPSWGALGLVLRRVLELLGAVSGCLGLSWAGLGVLLWLWGDFGTHLGPVLGPLWAVLGTSWGLLGPLLGPSWDLGGRSWSVLGPQNRIRMAQTLHLPMFQRFSKVSGNRVQQPQKNIKPAFHMISSNLSIYLLKLPLRRPNHIT